MVLREGEDVAERVRQEVGMIAVKLYGRVSYTGF